MINSMKRFKVSTNVFILLVITFLLVACQPNPTEDIIVKKDSLKEAIKNVAIPTQTGGQEKSWQYRKDYDSGNSVIVDSLLYNNRSFNLPVISVSPKKFESGDQLKKIVNIFYSNKRIYDTGDALTKSSLEQSIIDVKELIYRVENDLPIIPEKPESVVNQDKKEAYINQLNGVIEDYKSQLETAPDESELNEASYKLVDREPNGFQSNMTAITDKGMIFFDFVNRADKTGSRFFLESSSYSAEIMKKHSEFLTPGSFEGDIMFEKTKQKVDKYISDMGINYMSLNSVSKGEDSYSLYYVRTYKGLSETYVNNYIGTTVTGTDASADVMDLWEPEYIKFEMQNDKIAKVTWVNPSKVINIDNENVYTKSWEEIKEIFINQMDYMLSPERTDKIVIHIDRVELGFTKLLMKNTQDEYKLIPTWCFMGYETDPSDPIQVNENTSAPVCFITINAIDGSVIDRGLMY